MLHSFSNPDLYFCYSHFALQVHFFLIFFDEMIVLLNKTLIFAVYYYNTQRY